MSITWPSPERAQAFSAWLSTITSAHQLQPGSLSEASSDASSRRYLRIETAAGGSLIIMDAPPESQDVRPFIRIAAQMDACGLLVPKVLAADEAQGFLLLSDLGQLGYLQALQQAQPAETDQLMRAAIQALLQWQTRGDAAQLPAYDEAFIRRELQIFTDWCVEKEHGIQWTEQEQAWWEHCCQRLVQNMLAQPQVAMHRDFMARNLMVCASGPGVLDFQDAVRGPISYDIASLLRDAFISFDEERELDWAIRYWEQARKLGLPVGEDFGEFWRQLEWTGLQRHLKILGIFCRLKHRDGKPRYAEDLPRFMAYATKVATRYIEFSPLVKLLERMQPSLTQTSFSLR